MNPFPRLAAKGAVSTISLSFVLAVLPVQVASSEIDAAYAQRVAETVQKCTVSSRVGPTETPLPLNAANFLLDHPDLSADLARRHKLAPYRIVMRGPRESWADDGEGITGTIALVANAGNRRTYFAEGTHKSALFPLIHASAVIFLEISSAAKAGCGPSVVSSFDVYVRVRNPFLSGMIKLLKPFLKGLVVRKFSKAFLVAHKVGRLAARNPELLGDEIVSYPGLSEEDRVIARELSRELRTEPHACL